MLGAHTSSSGDERLDDCRIAGYTRLLSRNELAEKFAAPTHVEEAIRRHRQKIKQIVHKQGSIFLVILGPCSIDDPETAFEYSDFVLRLTEEYGSRIMFCMRTYLEKPRSEGGWEGYITDPFLTGEYDYVNGIPMSLDLLLKLSAKLPLAGEFVSPTVANLVAHHYSYGCIGARTVQAPDSRALASGMSMPMGMKNTTDGSLKHAITAVRSARKPHALLAANPEGHDSQVRTLGNSDAHVILRGGDGGPNSHAGNVALVSEALPDVAVAIDGSHGNSNKDCKKQGAIFLDAGRQFAEHGLVRIAMLESYIHEGKQNFPSPETVQTRKRGLSVTDACIGQSETYDLCGQLFEILKPVSNGWAPWQQ
ncbi:MAG: 3-deoxy-7-phosphoheptulonate synthase [Candidatus Pacebacteria bacterium]|nr:3-deoxy-7-phosphoheptulonate synthase [Candidatus Paceibacterota bacterium]MDD5357145.1 3-deoxy-7-phosphoheptulonate synthase [Candidatus Paceibacterota bacterium]